MTNAAIMPITLTPKQASEYLQIGYSTLARWRSDNAPNSPAYIKVGNAVLYLKSDLDEWLFRNRREMPTKEIEL